MYPLHCTWLYLQIELWYFWGQFYHLLNKTKVKFQIIGWLHKALINHFLYSLTFIKYITLIIHNAITSAVNSSIVLLFDDPHLINQWQEHIPKRLIPLPQRIPYWWFMTVILQQGCFSCMKPKIYFLIHSISGFVCSSRCLKKSFPLLHSYFLTSCIPGTSTKSSVNWYSLYPVTCCHTTHMEKIVRPTTTCLTSFLNLLLTISVLPSFDDHFHNYSFHVCSYRRLALLSYPANTHQEPSFPMLA